MSAAKKRAMSKAQLEFMKEHLPAYIAWMQATGQSVGIKMQPWQKRIVEALIRKGMLTPDGHVTERGMKGYERKFSVILPRFDHQIKGATADLVIVDDQVSTTV
jgi:hypothetical protein